MTDIVTIERRSDSARFGVLLPGWFLVCALLATMAPGHGWQLFAVGTIPGVWAAFLFGEGNSAVGWLLPTLFVGLPLLWFLGRMLDRLHADIRLWLLAAVVGAGVAGYLMLQSYARLELAFDRHGSFLAFLFCALQLGSYGATLLLLIFSAGRRS